MINRTFRLFISSTFDDFERERQILNDLIFEEVDKHCQSKGYNFQLVDLRWGVNSESALKQNTLSICLEEVRRCKELSPKPNFLIMVGERYGWIPLPSQITTTDFNHVVSACSKEDITFLQSWYLLDTNEIGGVYYLKNRIGEFVDDLTWAGIENRLRKILLTCAASGKLSPTFVSAVQTSATEAEIIEGLLGDVDVRNNTIAVFRRGYSKKDADPSKVNALRQRIIDRLEQDGCKDNMITLNYDEDYFNCFYCQIVSLLKKSIDAEISRLNGERHDIDSRIVIQQVLAECEAGYFRRDSLIRQIDNYVKSDSPYPLFISGVSGSGKTTLLADYLGKTSINYFCSFYGLTEHSYTLVDSLNQVFIAMRQRNTIQKTFTVNLTNISEMVYKALHAVPDDKQALIVIDGLDMFTDVPQIHESVFPTKLPTNVKLIISAADATIIKKFKHARTHELHLESVDAITSYTSFTRLLQQHNRCISNPQQEKIVKSVLSHGTTPIYIHLLGSLCSRWHSGDIITNLPTSAEEMAMQSIVNMFEELGHNREFVLYTLSLIAAAPFGIAEEEILQLLLRFPSVKAYFTAEDRHGHNQKKLPFVIWARLFYDLKSCLTLAMSNGCIVVKFRHQIFYNVLTQVYPRYLREACKMLTLYYLEQDNYCTGTDAPNLRKVFNLLALLKKNDDLINMCRVLKDISFMDAVVKVGHVDELIESCSYVLSNGIDTQHDEQLLKIYRCLQYNRNRLLCYKDNFSACAYESGLSGQPVPALSCKSSPLNNQLIFFPYSTRSAISWFEDGKRYAVCYGSYVYICEKDSNLELCRIYLEPDSTENAAIARNTVWIDKNTVAIATQEELLIHGFDGLLPRLINRFSYSPEGESVRYIEDYQMLLFFHGRHLCSRNPFTGEEYYSIPVSNPNAGFNADVSEDELYVCSNASCIEIFNLVSGKHKKTHRTRKKKKLFEDWSRKLQGYGIVKLNSASWFIYSTDWYAIFDSKAHSITYLAPPKIEQRIQSSYLLPGKRSCIVVYGSLLIHIDLADKFRIHYYPVKGVSNVSWVFDDEVLSILSQDGFSIVSVHDFYSFAGEELFCFQSKQELTETVSDRYRIIENLAFDPILNDLINPSSTVFSYTKALQLVQYADSKIWGNHDGIATIAIQANDGKIAVAYESENAIEVFDSNERPLLYIDKLQLAINDNILDMFFSPDSQCLLIWRNHSIVVIDIKRGKKIFKMDLSLRPALGVRFSSNSLLLIVTLCDEREYVFCREKHKYVGTQPIPVKIVPSVDQDAYFGPYNIYPPQYQKRTHTRINIDALNSTVYPRKWFHDTRAYISDSFWLLFDNGEFYLNGDKNAVFSHLYYDFGHSLQIERQSDASEIAMYLREKNDTLSQIIEIDNHHFVLISRILNSIILFDSNKMEILAAYKHTGNIVGIKGIEKNTIELFCDTSPYLIKVQINLI